MSHNTNIFKVLSHGVVDGLRKSSLTLTLYFTTNRENARCNPSIFKEDYRRLLVKYRIETLPNIQESWEMGIPIPSPCVCFAIPYLKQVLDE